MIEMRKIKCFVIWAYFFFAENKNRSIWNVFWFLTLSLDQFRSRLRVSVSECVKFVKYTLTVDVYIMLPMDKQDTTLHLQLNLKVKCAAIDCQFYFN